MSDQPISPGFLVWEGGAEPKRRFPLSQEVITIGRAKDSDLVIDNDDLSRHHARLTWGGHGWILEDLGSSNGTSVDGQRITGPVVLAPGSEVTLGTSVVLSLATGAPEAASPESPGPAAGAGVPGVMLSAETTEKIIVSDHNAPSKKNNSIKAEELVS